MVYNQSHLWNIQVLNPVSNEIIEQSNHTTIDDIYKKYPNIPLNTWRNICMGRSKIYEKFIKVKKIDKPKKETEPKKLIDNTTTLITFD